MINFLRRIFGITEINRLTVEINRLIEENINLQDQLSTEQNINAKLVEIIRDMDQQIWTLGQQPSWERMQPLFADLLEDTTKRMNEESSRIRDILIPEIRKVFHD